MGNDYSGEMVEASKNWEYEKIFKEFVKHNMLTEANQVRIEVATNMATSILNNVATTHSQVDLTSEIKKLYEQNDELRENLGTGNFLISGSKSVSTKAIEYFSSGVTAASPHVMRAGQVLPVVGVVCGVIDSQLNEQRLKQLERLIFDVTDSLKRETDIKICIAELLTIKATVEAVKETLSKYQDRSIEALLVQMDVIWKKIANEESILYYCAFFSLETIGNFLLLYLLVLSNHPASAKRLEDCKEQAGGIFKKYLDKAVKDKIESLKLDIDLRWLQTAGLTFLTSFGDAGTSAIKQGHSIIRRSLSPQEPKKSKNKAYVTKLNFTLTDKMTNKIYFDYFIHYTRRDDFEHSKTHPYLDLFGGLPKDCFRIPSARLDDFYDPYYLVSEIRTQIERMMREKHTPTLELLQNFGVTPAPEIPVLDTPTSVPPTLETLTTETGGLYL